MTGVGMAVDGGAYQLGRVLDKRLAYEFSKSYHQNWKTPISPTPFKTPIGSVSINTGFVKNVAKGLKVGGVVLGVGMTTAEIITGQKSLVGEGGLDLIMGGVAFIPGGDWVASGAYFGGKYLLESTGNDFWNK